MARKFNGTSSFGQSIGTIDLSGTNVCTISFWLYWDSFANDDDLALESSANSNLNGNTILIDPGESATGRFQVAFHEADPAKLRAESFTRPANATWHHYAFALDGNLATRDIVVYVDGVLTSTTLDGNTPLSDANFGNYTWYLMSRGGASLFGDGRMAYFTIHNRLLSKLEVNLLRLNFGSVTQGLVALVPIIGTQVEPDFSGKRNNFKFISAPYNDSDPLINLGYEQIRTGYFPPPYSSPTLHRGRLRRWSSGAAPATGRLLEYPGMEGLRRGSLVGGMKG